MARKTAAERAAEAETDAAETETTETTATREAAARQRQADGDTGNVNTGVTAKDLAREADQNAGTRERRMTERERAEAEPATTTDRSQTGVAEENRLEEDNNAPTDTAARTAPRGFEGTATGMYTGEGAPSESNDEVERLASDESDLGVETWRLRDNPDAGVIVNSGRGGTPRTYEVRRDDRSVSAKPMPWAEAIAELRRGAQ